MKAISASRRDGKLTVALISEVFYEADGAGRLRDRLIQAADRGADLAVLPEIPLNPWRPATKTPVNDDAEPTMAANSPATRHKPSAGRTTLKRNRFISEFFHNRGYVRPVREHRPVARQDRRRCNDVTAVSQHNSIVA